MLISGVLSLSNCDGPCVCVCVQQEEDEEVVAIVSEPDPELLQEIAEGPVAMVDQDLRSMKDKLLIETAEMLGVNMLSAAALLRQYGEWEWLGVWLMVRRMRV